MATEQDLVHLVSDRELRAKIVQIARGAKPLGLEHRDRIAEMIMDEVPDDLDALQKITADWRLWARPKQIEPPGNWVNWMILAGRGWGKTRVGAEWVHEKIDHGTYGRFYLIGSTAADARDIMIEGPSGIEATSRPWNKARYIPTKRKVEWESGAVALVFSAEEPERLRGEQAEAAWCDELAAWRYPETWQQAQLGLRLGTFPRSIITTTPRPTKLVKDLVAAPTTVVTQGITYENLYNLAPAFIAEIIREHEGTRFGRQEIYADILDDNPGALFHLDNISEHRVPKGSVDYLSMRTVIAVDPAISAASESDETGIIVACADDIEAWVLADHSGKYMPEQWAAKVSGLYEAFGADYVVAEENQGGDMVRHTIQVYDPDIKVKGVRAKKAKHLRADPVSALYEQGRVHHVGTFDRLEQQMTEWDPEIAKDSPDRLDALVYAVTDLLVGRRRMKLTMFSETPELVGASYWKGEGSGLERRVPWISDPE